MMEKKNIQRLFIALDFPRNILDELIAVQMKLRALQLYDGKYIVPEQIHLTLKFIGAVEGQHIPFVQAALRSIRYPSFEGCVGRLGVLPDERCIRIIWVDLVSDGLVGLVGEIEKALAPLCKLEERPFLSHITLVRVKHVFKKQELVQALSGIHLQKTCFKATEFILKKSDMTDLGSIYTDLEHYYLTL